MKRYVAFGPPDCYFSFLLDSSKHSVSTPASCDNVFVSVLFQTSLSKLDLSTESIA